MLTKVLEVHGKPTEKVHVGLLGNAPGEFNYSYIYPAGTGRVVRKLLLFPKELNGVKREIGLAQVSQRAEIDTFYGSDGSYSFNRWKDVEFVERDVFGKYSPVRVNTVNV